MECAKVGVGQWNVLATEDLVATGAVAGDASPRSSANCVSDGESLEERWLQLARTRAPL